MSAEHSVLNVDNLKHTSTDMLVDFLGNSDKIVDSDKRWKYVDHRNSEYSTAAPNKSDRNDGRSNHRKSANDSDDLDEDVDDYIPRTGIFHGNSNKHTDTTTVSDSETGDSETDKGFGPTLFDSSKRTPMTKDELMLAKLNMLRKLGELKQCGVKLSQNYGLDSDLKMMEYEYKLHTDIRSKQNSVQWMGHMLIGIIKGGEMLNDNYNPFDVKLDGLSTKISSDMNAYYAVLGEIYEKYNQPGKDMAPELKLIMMITGATLSMQVNKALPGFMGGVASSVQTDSNIKDELRRKAASDSHDDKSVKSNKSNRSNKSNKSGGSNKSNRSNKSNKNNAPMSYAEQQHAAAVQQIADLKYIKEKQLELERSLKLAEQARAKGGFILSSEVPDSEDKKEFTREEIELMKKEREMREIKYLEALRQKAQINSQAYRTGSSQSRNEDLERQSRNLDDILGSLEDNVDTDFENRVFKDTKNISHPERVVQKSQPSKPKASNAKTSNTKSANVKASNAKASNVKASAKR